MRKNLILAVIGSSSCTKKEELIAYEVGREIAKHGAVLVCGGLGGVMEAACRGAKENGGTTVGILPGTNSEDANYHVDIPVVTGMGIARNLILVLTAQAIIAIAGGYGTLSEIAYASQLKVPLVGIDTWKINVPMELAKTPVEAVNIAIQLALKNQG